MVLLCSINGCSIKPAKPATLQKEVPRDNTPKTLTPDTEGTTIFENDIITIDASNISSVSDSECIYFFDSKSVSVFKGSELAKDCYCDLDVIENIYYFVTQTITYDKEKAQSVSYGYIPNPDETHSLGKGICFDYASLMTAMLRSQQIPTRLEVGYAGEVYHAWISCYVDEIAWVDHIIQFDGESWSLMDPTLAANNSNTAVQEYIGDGNKYIVKYTY